MSAVVYLRAWDDFAYSQGMEYVFPNEHVFMGGVVVLIVALLVVRVKLARQRRTGTPEVEQAGVSIEHTKGRPPLV